jgi:hypothetical protein
MKVPSLAFLVRAVEEKEMDGMVHARSNLTLYIGFYVTWHVQPRNRLDNFGLADQNLQDARFPLVSKIERFMGQAFSRLPCGHSRIFMPQ